MKESQNVEYKQSWRDEYLKWICGFANARGGELYIGLNDKGKVVGLSNTKKLIEDIPNKIQAILGIVCDVDLLIEKGKEYLKIKVEPHTFPVSYKGQYHYRSGSTKQELKGSALDQFILKKQGKHWDSVPVPRLSVENLDIHIIEEFRRTAVDRQRLDESSLDEGIANFLHRLKLLDDNNYLTRAAVLLFSRQPENKVSGAYVKIAYFKTEADIIFQDLIEGDLFLQADKVLDLIKTKYTRALISYEGSIRLDTPPVPHAALREAIYNAIVHKDYESSNPIQIRVYDDKIRIWNACRLPDGWDVKKLTGEHSSEPYNPDIAAAFFRTGRIESWGRGIEKIFTTCRNAVVPDPIYVVEQTGLWIEFPFSQKYKTALEKIIDSTGHDTGHDTEQVKRLLSLMDIDREYSRAELMDELAMKHRETFSENYLKPAIRLGYIEMTISDKPKSKNQRYRICHKKQLGDIEK